MHDQEHKECIVRLKFSEAYAIPNKQGAERYGWMPAKSMQLETNNVTASINKESSMLSR